MSGSQPNRFVLDTNAVIQLLKGNQEVLKIITNAEYLAISVISELEFMAFNGMSQHDQLLFTSFKSRVVVMDLASSDQSLINCICHLRSQSSLKLPDVIIAASAMVNDAILVTADAKLLTYLGNRAQSFGLI